MTFTARDVINEIGGFAPGSPATRFRALRPVIAGYAQGTYEELLEPDDPAGVSYRERAIVGLRVGILTPDPEITAWYRERLRVIEVPDHVIHAVEQFPGSSGLTSRETAILLHTDLVIRNPGATEQADIDALRHAGLATRDIVTIAQLIAYLSFQVRVLAVSRLFAEDA